MLTAAYLVLALSLRADPGELDTGTAGRKRWADRELGVADADGDGPTNQNADGRSEHDVAQIMLTLAQAR